MLNLSERLHPKTSARRLPSWANSCCSSATRTSATHGSAYMPGFWKRNSDLRDRCLRKLHGYAEQLALTLITRGSPERVAAASEFALTCYFPRARLAERMLACSHAPK